jgi:dTDP-L-rhamnose 4-epimerase
VAAIFAARLLNGRPPLVFEDGHQSRDFIHVSDIVEGIVLALDARDAVGQAINLGTGRPTTVDDVARVLAEELAVEIDPVRTGQYRAGDIRHCYANPARAEELLGFSASTRFEDGIRDLVAWLADQKAVDRVDQATSELLERGLAR